MVARKTQTVEAPKAETKKAPEVGTPLSEMGAVTAALVRLGLDPKDATFRGFGKVHKIGSVGVYINRGNLDVRSTIKTVADWSKQGLGTIRGEGQYLRVSTK